MEGITKNASVLQGGDFGSMTGNGLSENMGMEGAQEPFAVTTPQPQDVLRREDVQNLTESVDNLSDITTGLGNTMTNADGSVIDISDKAGRQADRRYMKETKDRINEVLGKVPEGVDATLCDDDRKRMDKVLDYFKTSRWLQNFLFVVNGILFGILCMQLNDARVRSNELEYWYIDQRDAICFGHYIREHDKHLYEYWYTGRWQRNEAYKDSVEKAHLYKRWDKDIIEKDKK